MSHHSGAKQRIQNALDVIEGEYGGKLELGKISALTGIGIGTPAGCYPVTVALEAACGTPEYYREKEHVAELMRHIGWHEAGSPDPLPGNKLVFNLRPDVVRRLIDSGIGIQGQEHFSPTATGARAI